MRFPRNAGLLLLLPVLGCQQLAGVRDVKVVEVDAGALDRPTFDQCRDYCDRIATGCASDSEVAAYKNDEYCMATCDHFPLAGTPPGKELFTNNFECRLSEAITASRIADPSEAESNCRAAGLGGDGECGQNCESYCQQFREICQPERSENCEASCAAMVSDPNTNARSAFEDGIDTIQCRMAHLSAAAIDPSPHCEHATILPTQPGPCYPAVPTCAQYCAVLMNTCQSEDVRQYDSVKECETVCNKGMVPSSTPVDDAANLKNDTLACRRYHTYNALVNNDRKVHCAHAGPSGDGHCGKGCPAYCAMVEKACPDGFRAAFPGGRNECETDCADLAVQTTGTPNDDFKYTVAKGLAGGDNIECRVYNTVKAFSDPAACVSALGGGACK